MDHRLAGVEQRLRRAHEHLTFLDEVVPMWFENVDRRVFGYFDDEASQYVFYVNSGQPPAEWGIFVSEFTHHIRAGLEETVWRLVEFRGGTPTVGKRGKAGTGFPILNDKGAWRSPETKSMLRGLSSEDKAIIRAAQPYQLGRNVPTDMDKASIRAEREWLVSTHSLHLLKRLNNTDKHSILQPALLGAAGMAQPIGKDRTIGPTAIKDCGPWDLRDVMWVTRPAGKDRTEVMRVRLRDPGTDPQMEMKNEVALGITLDHTQPGLGWDWVRDILAYAENKVIKPLSAAFDV